MAHEAVPWDGGRKAVGNDYVVVYVEQTKSLTPGKIRLKARTYIYYPPYQYDTRYWGTLDVYVNNSKVLHGDYEWVRLSGSGFKTFYSPWFETEEIDNTEVYNVHAVSRISSNNPSTESSYDFAIYPRQSYLLTRTLNSHIDSLTYSIIDEHGINGGDRLDQTESTAIIYDGDTYSWVANASSGSKLNPSSGSGIVSGDILIAPEVDQSASMQIRDAMGWNSYTVYRMENGSWIPYQAKVRHNGAWDNYS